MQGPREGYKIKKLFQIDHWDEVCRRCGLEECARPEGFDRDLTKQDSIRFAARGCAMSKAHLLKVKPEFVLQNLQRFNLLTDEQIEERWG